MALEGGLTRFRDFIPEGTLNSYDVTKLTETDVSAYTELMRKVISEADFLDEAAKAELLETKTEVYYRQCLKDQDKWTLLVTRVGEEIVGVLEASKENNGQTDFGFVRWVCVDNNYQGKGVGPSLYDGYEQILRDRSIPFMVATIQNTNLPSLKMHKQFGFDMKNPFFKKVDTASYFKKI